MRCAAVNEPPLAQSAGSSSESRCALANLVRYARRGDQIELVGAVEASEVLFIDEHTSPPAIQRSPRMAASRDPCAADVFYIGPE